mmetsp:Transcript_49933/g.79569  ORF Transcript_49933/g.79569 Transcript_49933/m.79569 type:complete len:271 (-) Transcript_49933:312-1124(-)
MMLVLQIPIDCLFQAMLKRHHRFPAQRRHLLSIHIIPRIMKRPISDKLDIFRMLTLLNMLKARQHSASHLHRIQLRITCDIIDFSDHSAMQQRIKRIGRVRNVQINPRVFAVAIDADRFAVVDEIDEFRNEFLWELLRSIHVARARDNHRQFERTRVRMHNVLRRCLARRVRIGRQQSIRFLLGLFVAIVHVGFAVHFVSRDMDEQLKPSAFVQWVLVLIGSPCTLQQNVCAHHVGLCELERVVERQIDVRLGREVQHHVDLVLVEYVTH